jgi:asparagine synthase (glutamine-hydrolysing)
MCGIAGKLTSNPAADGDLGDLMVAMTTALRHRGPDAGGYYFGDGIALGHRRLSIIDLATGDQPVSNEDGSVWVVFNGEIYNFQDLRRDLEAAGHRFRTHSDTEVIVHGYEEWGEACVTRFRGMFAFAVWDTRARRLLLARDRLGVKPLFYAPLPDGTLVFASEMKAILEDRSVSRAWRPESVDAYLTFGYIPGPATIYEHIQKLPAAHVLVAENGRIRTHEYWDLIYTGDGDPAREDEYLQRLDVLLRESVKLRLISDVPLGAFLSGGIDSTAVVAYMMETSDAPVLTASVGFDQTRFDELEHARTVATHLGCERFERIADPHVVDLLPRLAWHFDEPFADSSAVPTYYVSQAARERVTVALSGDGGDELWAGYARHRVEHWEGRVRAALGPRGSRAVGMGARLLPMRARGVRALRHLGLPPADACAVKHAYGLFENGVRASMYSGDFEARIAGTHPYAPFLSAYDRCPSPDPMDRAMYVDVKTYLVDDILTKVDRMSMAVSLETREPLLDHRLLEFAATVPASLKLRGRTTKFLLRKLLARRVPASILERPKHGFEAPAGEWLRGPLAGMVADLLVDRRFRERGLLNAKTVDRLWAEHRDGRCDHRHRLWSVVMLELWFRQFIDQTASSVVDEAPVLAARERVHRRSAGAGPRLVNASGLPRTSEVS